MGSKKVMQRRRGQRLKSASSVFLVICMEGLGTTIRCVEFLEAVDKRIGKTVASTAVRYFRPVLKWAAEREWLSFELSTIGWSESDPERFLRMNWSSCYPY
jgi:hypothetical protein